MSKDVGSLQQRIEELEAQITGAAEAPTVMETDARLEIATAKIEGRQPLPWATDYMAFVKSSSSNYF
jgi:hypothetical protein